MQDAETGNWIVYNGEIYNFRELRTRLQGEGAQFVSQSDTEVLLQAYGCWGEKCLGELRGMFAFAIWDAKRSRLLLGRDPMGIKPLYYCSSGPYFLFASELRTLLGTGLIARRLDPAGLINYLNFGSVYDPNTMIQGVSALQAGHYAVWEGGRLRDTMYWDLAPHGQAGTAASYLVGNATARKDLENEIYATLDQAVRMQTVSDVPVGLFLSGGIDSSSSGRHSEPGGEPAQHVFHYFPRGGIQRSRIFPRGGPGLWYRTPGDHGFTGRCARRHPVRAPGHGPAHHRRSQYISDRAADARRRDQGGSFRFGWGRVVCRLLQLSRRSAPGAL